MSNRNQLLANTLRSLADNIENAPAPSASQPAAEEGAAQQIEFKLDDILNLVQQLTLKTDGIISTLSNLQSQVLNIRSSIRAPPKASAEAPVAPSSAPVAPTITPSAPVAPSPPPQEAPAKKVDKKMLSEEDVSTVQKKLGDLERNITDLQFQYQSGFIEENDYNLKMNELKTIKQTLLSSLD